MVTNYTELMVFFYFNNKSKFQETEVSGGSQRCQEKAAVSGGNWGVGRKQRCLEENKVSGRNHVLGGKRECQVKTEAWKKTQGTRQIPRYSNETPNTKRKPYMSIVNPRCQRKSIAQLYQAKLWSTIKLYNYIWSRYSGVVNPLIGGEKNIVRCSYDF